MENKHISYFRVKNFKRFKDLEVKDIGQFNLVLGDNNVGKTSLLEGLLCQPDQSKYYNSFPETISFLLKALSFRNYGNLKNSFSKYYFNVEMNTVDPICFSNSHSREMELHFDQSTRCFTLRNKESFPPDEYKFRIIENQNSRKSKSFWEGRHNIIHEIEMNGSIDEIIVPFIAFQRSYEVEAARLYLESIQRNKIYREKFISGLRSLFSEIESVEFSLIDNEMSIEIYRKDSNYSIPLAFYGEGTIKVAKLLSYFIRFQNRFVMIDEIDAGLYHSRMTEFWKTVLISSQENNVQLFATTHNLECIRAFHEAVSEMGKEYETRSRIISLIETPIKEVKSVTYKFESFEHNLLAGNEIR